jgi:hypothetical protein
VSRKRPRVHDAALAALGLAAIVAALVGGALLLGALRGDEEPTIPPGLDAGDPGPVHVHGLGIDPADGSLFIATHTGTWRVADGETTAERVGDSYQDTMGFTVVGPNHFLGSGHPDLDEAREKQLPPHLGLIESKDAGRTWTSVSLLGAADFHVLRTRAGRIYGYDATGGRLLLSEDGRRWDERPTPAPLLDLAVDPGNASHLIATTERGLHQSLDQGRTWTRLRDLVGLLAWPERALLYVVTADGRVFVTADRARWRQVGSVGSEPAALLGRSGRELYVALHDGTIKQSTDGGRSWRVRSMP